MKKTALFVSTVFFVFLLAGALMAQTIQLPKTGQTACYDENGNTIDCAGTGQDGDIQAGVAWPSPRFTDNGDGTIIDQLTGLICLKDASCAGQMTRNNALSFCNNLTNGSCGLMDGSIASDWRLPNIMELESLTNADSPLLFTWLDSQGLINVQPSFYWSSTVSRLSSGYYAFSLNMNKYIGITSYKSSSWCEGDCPPPNKIYVLPVRGEQNGTIQTSVARSSLGFTDNGNGTITDQLTGLVWLKNANCAGQMNWNGALSFCNNLASGSYELTDGSVAGDWRLPNRKELLSLIDYSQYNPSLPMGHPFSNVQSNYYWSSTSNAYSPNAAFTITMSRGNASDYDKIEKVSFIWPVRNDKIPVPPPPILDIVSLEAVDVALLNGRTPLVLIHGNNMENETDCGWKKYLKKIKSDKFMKKNYKVYLTQWDSSHSNLENGLSLGKAIDSLPELDGAQIVFLAHSRGGIIARYFMNRYTMQSGTHAGQSGGEKTKWLVTLGTPHRGSPGADPIWVSASFDCNFPDPIELALMDIYFTDPILPFFPSLYDPASYQQLLWDDSENKLTSQAVCYNSALSGQEECVPLMSKTILNNISQLNKTEQYFNKIIAYGGNNYKKTLSQRMTRDINSWIRWVTLHLKTWTRHNLLDLSTMIMERMPIIPPGYDRVPDNPERPFSANDGMVPLGSALFLGDEAAKELFRFNKNKLFYDQSQLDSMKQIAECHVLNGAIDHLDLLDKGAVIETIINKLKNLD